MAMTAASTVFGLITAVLFFLSPLRVAVATGDEEIRLLIAVPEPYQIGVSYKNAMISCCPHIWTNSCLTGISFKYKQPADILKRNFDIIERTKTDNIHYKCMVLVYDNIMPPFLSPNNWIPQCDFERYQEAGYGDNMKAITPQLVKYGGFTHVMILLDDIELQPNYSLSRMFYYIDKYKLTVAQPGIINAQVGRCIYQPKRNEGYMIQNLEIFTPIFDIPSWNCFWDLVDPKYNNKGLGYELFYYPRCVQQARLRLGVIQNMSAAQVLRIEEAMPPDYALNQSTKESGKDIVLSSIFGQKDDANSQGVVRSITNYHDERFIKAMNRCGGSLTESCRRSLLKVYKEKHNYGRVEWAKNERKFGRPMLEGTRSYHSRLFQNFGKPRKDKRLKNTDKDW